MRNEVPTVKRVRILSVLALTLAVSFAVADTAAAKQGSVQTTPIPPPCPKGRHSESRKCVPVKYKTCASLRTVYPKGVARDAKSAASTGAIVDATWYRLHAGLDRDKDGIACES
jgi:hypothetical protein